MEKNIEDGRLRTRERILDRYVLALDRGDLDDLSAVLDAAYEAALDDPEIDHLITEINRSFRADAEITPITADENLVRELLRRHVPSAFISQEHLKRSLTVGDVASKLQAQGRVQPCDEEANRSLLSSVVPLPKLLNAQEIKKLSIKLGVNASDFFWRAFRDVAITMGIGRSHSQAQLAARERKARRSPRRKKDR
jgi:hypothetical protein